MRNCHLANHTLAGFIAATGAIEVSTNWERCFSVTWIIGFCGGATVYYAICLLSPPPGKPYETVPYEIVIVGDSTSDQLSATSVPTQEQKRPEPGIKGLGDA